MGDKKWYTSKSIWVQFLGLIGMVLIAAGVVQETQWAMYVGVATEVIGIVMRFVTKGSVTW
ncbi:MAG: hypothetical protein KKB31_07435 [Nanoarchaeota archaeon]|nr:hypothetical protein [Nanoarchaeota archaeon]